MLHDMYSGFDFSINSTKANDCLAQNSDGLSLSGLSQYWLVEKDLLQNPGSFELLAFWRHYHSTAERIMQNGNEKQLADFYEEAELTSKILDSKAEDLLDTFCTVRGLLYSRLGIKTEEDIESKNIDSSETDEYRQWKSEINSMELTEHQDYFDYAQDHYLGILEKQRDLKILLSEKKAVIS